MKIIIDDRETSLYEKFISLQSAPINTTKQVLHLGDIVLTNDDDTEFMIIERKSLQDLLSSIKDGRYEEQSHRLMYSCGLPRHHIVYVIEGVLSTLRLSVEKQLIFSTMTSLQVFKGFSVVRTSSVQETAEWLLTMTNKIQKDLAKGKIPWNLVAQPNNNTISNDNAHVNVNPPSEYCTVVKKVKKENITPSNIGEIFLCQIPGVSHVFAIAIMQQYTSIANLIKQLDENPKCLNGITYLSKNKLRKISKTVIENIIKYLTYSGKTEVQSSNVQGSEVQGSNTL